MVLTEKDKNFAVFRLNKFKTAIFTKRKGYFVVTNLLSSPKVNMCRLQ